ncbi:hypothetical protein ES708_33739 [subsurface metagenome]
MLLAELFGNHGCFYVGRGDAVHRNPGGRSLCCQGKGQTDHRTFRHRVGSACGNPAALGCEGTDIDDPAPLSLLHPRQTGLAEVERPVKVHPEDLVPLLRRGLGNLIVGKNARVVYQGVYWAALRLDLLYGAAAGFGVADVEGDGIYLISRPLVRYFSAGCFQGFRVDIGHSHPDAIG